VPLLIHPLGYIKPVMRVAPQGRHHSFSGTPIHHSSTCPGSSQTLSWRLSLTPAHSRRAALQPDRRPHRTASVEFLSTTRQNDRNRSKATPDRNLRDDR